MLRTSVLLLLSLPYVLGSSNIERNARVIGHTEYFTTLIQETVNEWERRGFCTLKLDEFTRPVNVSMFSWRVVGNVTYTNAFLVSIQKLEVTGMAQSVWRSTINGESITFASVRGTLHLRDSLYGYDVIFDQADEVHRFTGTYGYGTTNLLLEVMKNLRTNELSTSMTLSSLAVGFPRMLYMPANHLTQVLSREFSPVTSSDSIRAWGRNFLAPLMLEIAQTKVDFPRICYSNMC